MTSVQLTNLLVAITLERNQQNVAIVPRVYVELLHLCRLNSNT